MKLITRDTDYAIRALMFMAKSKQKMLPVGSILGETEIPRPFLRKVMQKLNRKHITKSFKGKGGGFVLIKDPKKIFLIDVVTAFQGPVRLTEHLFKKRVCQNVKKCKLKKKLDSIENYIVSQLKSISLFSILK